MMITILNSPDATIIPCRHIESGVIGLYNAVDNVFIPVKDTAGGIWKMGADTKGGEDE